MQSIELLGARRERQVIDLKLDYAARAVYGGRRSVDSGVPSCLDAVLERGHGLVRFLLQVVVGVEGTPRR